MTSSNPPTANEVITRYNSRSQEYCYWSHEEVTALVNEIERLRAAMIRADYLLDHGAPALALEALQEAH